MIAICTEFGDLVRWDLPTPSWSPFWYDFSIFVVYIVNLKKIEINSGKILKIVLKNYKITEYFEAVSHEWYWYNSNVDPTGNSSNGIGWFLSKGSTNPISCVIFKTRIFSWP